MYINKHTGIRRLWWFVVLLCLVNLSSYAQLTLSADCQTATASLTGISASNMPPNTSLTWHTATPTTDANKLSSLTAVPVGTYYAAFYDAANGCYSTANTTVSVVAALCISNVCPATTANLSTAISSSNIPVGTVLTWHSAFPATTANKIADPTSVGAGSYYAAFFDATNNCYSGDGLAVTEVIVSISPCASAISLSNTCPATTVNLNTAVSATNLPSGTSLTWHTGTPATTANKVATPTAVIAGTYYAAFEDAANNCYSPASNAVTVTINNCNTPISLSNTCPATTVNLNTAVSATNLPSGTSLTWHTGTPATTTNKVADAMQVGAGNYYAAFFDATNNCYSPASDAVTVTINACNTPVSLSNTCPATTVNLTTAISPTNVPSGASVTWHTGTPATTANKVADAMQVGAGTYYFAYFDATANCYSATSQAFDVVINSCPAIQVTNTCPATTVNLTTAISPTNVPSGASVTWHTGTPATAANKVTDATQVGAGTYYFAYFDATANCYSATSQAIEVVINSCPAIQVTNTCPATTVNLTTAISPTNVPSGAIVTWHTGTPATAANKVADATQVGAGTYYLAFFDATANCYSQTSQAVTVSTTVCAPIALSNVCPVNTVNLTTAISATNIPSGASITWHTGTPATAANKVADATQVGAGTYYLAFFDNANNCYSQTSQAVTVTVTTCNLPPVATNDVAVTPQDKPVSGNVLTNDDDPEGGVLTVTTTPTTPPSKGTVVLQPNGSYTYTPNPGVTGEDKFCYSITDAQGLKDTACVTIEIVPNMTHLNDAPIAVDDNSQTEVGVPVVIAVKANDNDPEGLPLGTPTKLTNPTNGTAVVNPDGTVTYTPNSGFTGTDSFTYSVCDTGSPVKCDTATVTVNVVPTIPGNNPPVAVDDAELTSKNTPVSSTVATNDSDVDNTAAQLVYTKLSNPTNGTVTFQPDGSYNYVPTTGYVGSDSFLYKVCDPSGACDTATVSIAILPPAPLAPIATNDIAQTPQDKPVSGNVLTNDDDPEGGVLTVTTTPTTPPSKGTVVLNPDGSYTYTPTTGATGQDSFCYKVCDNGSPSLCDTACVTVNIIPNIIHLNNAPIALDDNTQTEMEVALVINAKANDTDPDGNNTLGNPSKLTNPTHGSVTQNPDGTFVYTPTTGFVGTDSFTYSICDTNLPSKCDTATVTVNIVPTISGNNPPVAVDDATLTLKNKPVGSSVAANDSDVDNTASQLTYTKISNPTNGSVTLNADGTYTYTPNANYVGSDSFLYKVCDPSGACDTATVSVAILDPGKVRLLPQAYLQGALFGVTGSNLMRDDLRVKGLIPTTSPYPAMGMTEVTPTGTVASSVFAVTGTDAIVDWVYVELRDASNNQQVLDSRSALIQRDGDIVDLDGISVLQFNKAAPANYYVVVKHRNHLGVMSKTALPLSTITTTVDFRTPSTPTYTFSTAVIDVAQVVVEQGVALWAGNALFDNKVIYQGTTNDVNTIYQQVINASGNLFISSYFKLRGYYGGDINMNGEVIFQGTGNDVEYIYQNVIKNHTGNILKQNFFIIKEQLP